MVRLMCKYCRSLYGAIVGYTRQKLPFIYVGITKKNRTSFRQGFRLDLVKHMYSIISGGVVKPTYTLVKLTF